MIHFVHYRVHQKSTSVGKFDICGIAVNFFAKLAVFTEEASGHIFCKFHCNIWLRSKITTIWT